MQSERCNMNNNGNGPQLSGSFGGCHRRRNCRDSREVKTMLIMVRRKLRHHYRIRNCNNNNKDVGHLFKMTIFVLLTGWLLELIGPIDCRVQQQHQAHRRLKTRSSLGDDEEELTLGHHFWASGARDEPAYSPPPPTAAEPERQFIRLQQAKSTRKRHDEEVFDPFASLFEDYLREASGTAAAKPPASDSDELPEPPAATQRQQFDPAPDSNQVDDRLRGDSVHLIDEDEPPNTAINNNMPPEAPATSGHLAIDHSTSFAWRSLRTNKCSKECGRGKRIVHLSCIDLKYNVRVQDELCLRADLERPSELSDEPCNEIDCQPSWIELSSETCQDERQDSNEANAIGRCQKRAQFKRLECMMTNRAGETVRLDEARCSSTSSSPTSGGGDLEDESSLIDWNEQIDKERNSILANDVLLGDMESSLAPEQSHTHGSSRKSQRANEPFYEPGEWSECAGASCGQLGRRTRKVACRLYLKRSARFVDLAPSRCQLISELERPDSEEPCYMDCGPGQSSRPTSADAPKSELATNLHRSGGGPSNESESSASSDSAQLSSGASNKYSDLTNNIRPIELEDETVYDLELARHVWRHGASTKCSAECLGGRSESIVECWDKVAELSVEANHCNAMTKPRPISNTCNEIPCAPEWLPSNFSNCSAACGSAGVRVREVTCVRRVPIASSSPLDQLDSDDDATGPSFELRTVPEEQCLEQQLLSASNSTADQKTAAAASKPHLMEPCNRHDCPPQWQVGPWSECTRPSASSGCTDNATAVPASNATQTTTRPTAGTRSRIVICVQEFASQFGPLVVKDNETTTSERASLSPDLREAINLAAPSWRPGKAIQVPFSECYRRFHSVPKLSEHCHHRSPIELSCSRSNITGDEDDDQSQSLSIDSEPQQNFRMLSADGHLLAPASWDSTAPTGARVHNHRNQHGGVQIRRRTITLKVGGRAQILEGWNVKIRCRVVRKTSRQQQNNHHSGGGLVRGELAGHATNQPVEWQKDGVRIFAPNTTVAERLQLTDESDNSILYGSGENQNEGQTSHDQYSLMAADEPPEAHQTRRRQRFIQKRPAGNRQGSGRQQSGRVLRVRSWSPTTLNDRLGSFQFVAQKGGRFSLVKENTLRIKRLTVDDSGLYSCTNGPYNESIEINVVSRHHLTTSPDLDQNQASNQNNY